MNADLEHLVVLQAQDLELTRLRAELLEAPRRVAGAESALREAEAALGRSTARLAEEEKLRRGQESEIATLQTKLARVRRSLEGATSTQQVAAFQHEIEFAANAVQQLEEEEFASLERTELLLAERPTTEAAVARAQASLLTQREHSATLQQRHGEAIAGIERERTALRAQVTPARLQSYDRLAKGRGTALAEAVGNATAGKCAACQMGVRPQRWQDLIGRDHLDEIFSCESCGRLLFWDPRRDTPKPWEAGDRLRAAAAGAAEKGGGAR